MSKTKEQVGREINASLDREDAYWRKQNELERHGRCPEHKHEVRGNCPKCRRREERQQIIDRMNQAKDFGEAGRIRRELEAFDKETRDGGGS